MTTKLKAKFAAVAMVVLIVGCGTLTWAGASGGPVGGFYSVSAFSDQRQVLLPDRQK